eukprot:99789_1
MCKDFGKSALDAVYSVCATHPKKVMAFWIISALTGAYWGLDLPNYAVFEYLPPDGSASSDAYNQVQKLFPQFLFTDYEIIVIQTKDNNVKSVISDTTQQLLVDINHTLWHEINPEYHMLVSFSTYFDHQQQIPINSPIYPLYKERFVNNANDTMICFISIDINNVEQDTINGFIDDLTDKLSSVKSESKYKQYTMISLTGALTMWNQGMKVMQDDMTTKDMMMMPLIFALMMYMVGSWRFIVIVGPVLGMSIIISLSTFVPFAKYNVFKLNPMVPSIMLFLGMALSVDYSMFLISRFTSEIYKGKTVQDAVREMIKYSAHVVILSGMVLIVSWFGVAFIPFSGMDTLGLGAIFCIFFCVIINITFTAATILAFPNFFAKLEILPQCCMLYCCCCCESMESKLLSKTLKTMGDNQGSLLAPSQDNASINTNNISPKIGGSKINKINEIESIISHPSHMSMYRRDHKDHQGAQNLYFKITQYTTKSPFNWLVPIIIYGAMTPMIYILFNNYQYSMDFTAYFPHDSTSVIAYTTMMKSFPPGDLWPYYILGITNTKNKPNKKIWTDEFYQSFCSTTRKLMYEYNIPSYHFHSVMYAPNITVSNLSNPNDINISSSEIFCLNIDYNYKGYNISMVNGMKLFYENSSEYINSSDPYYLYYEYVDGFLQTMISDTETASIMSFIPPFNPLLQSAVQPSRDIRSILDNININKTIHNTTKFYAHNSLYWQIDSMDKTDKEMPLILTLIIISIFILIGLMFKSLFLALRLFFVIIIPITFVYGFAVGIYVIGWFNWLNINSLKNTNGIIWMLPCISITILMGLAMDYEIFLFSRIIEYRYKGYSTRAAIILGCANTGPIISSAG